MSINDFFKHLFTAPKKGVRKGVRNKNKGLSKGVRNKNWNDVAWQNRKHHGINQVTGKKY